MIYRKEIDGLRGIAVLLVILFHSGWEFFSAGFLGVDIFFVISGYLIAYTISNCRNDKRIFVFEFLERRARRILPAFYFILFIVFIASLFVMLPSEMVEHSYQGISAILFYSNIYYSKLNGYFDSINNYSPLIHTWSLSIEVQYYAAFLILSISLNFFIKPIFFRVLFLIFLLSFLFSIYLSGLYSVSSFYFFESRVWEFLLGAIVVFIRPVFLKINTRFSIFHEVIGCFGLLLIISSGLNIGALNVNAPYFLMFPTLGVFLVLLFVRPSDFTSRILTSKLLVGLGLISYSAYLWHQPVFVFYRLINIESIGDPVPGYVYVLILFLSYFSWKYVESPFRSKNFLTGYRFFVAWFLFFITLLIIYSAAIFTNGFYNRYNIDQIKLIDYSNPIHKNYVATRFNDIKYKDFIDDSRVKVLIVGDSYAQDLVNAIYESGLDSKYQISTKHILKECGNLFLPRDFFKDHIVESRPGSCGSGGLYEDLEFRRIASTADEIWFASSWQNWHINYVVKSIESSSNIFGKKILVFGRKNLGYINIRNYLPMSNQSRIDLELNVPLEQIDINKKMKIDLPHDVYVDVQLLLCGDSIIFCKPFLDGSTLKTFDGTHLTKEGALFYGKQLSLILK